MRTALAIPFVLVLIVLGGSIVGYLSIFHDIPGAYGILGALAVVIAILTALQSHFPDRRA
jgi:hypothetical protein